MNDAGAFEFYENPENRESVPGTPSRRRPLRLYAVVLRDYKVVWIDYFWATDADRAMEQAVNAHPTSRYEAVSAVPYVKPREEVLG